MWTRRPAAVVASVVLALCAVGCGVSPPRSLSYATNPAVYAVGRTVEPNAPRIDGGAVNAYSVTPALPPGLLLDPSRGVISGTPAAVAGQADYVVMASNAGGSTTAVVTITVTEGLFVATGGMSTGRVLHSATLLPRGEVLVAGGGNGLASAERYDPATGTFAPTGSMSVGRLEHTATLLADGAVLVLGGFDTASLAEAEVYDPTSGTFAPTGAPGSVRVGHTATLLPDGRVLVAGGQVGTTALQSAELYDPATGSFSGTGDMTVGRSFHTATLLLDGSVLVAGGFSSGAVASAERYDPATGTFTPTGDLATARIYHTATLLPDGKVLVVGGMGRSNGEAVPLDSAELYDPATDTFASVGSLARARSRHTATLLPSGKVLAVGGTTFTGTIHVTTGPGDPTFVRVAELYDPATGTFSATGSPALARKDHAATLLPDGSVLVTGGFADVLGGFPRDAELYQELE